MAQEEARLLNHSFIGTEHILLGLLEDESAGGGTLTSLGITQDRADPWLQAELTRIANAKRKPS